ncbi:umecyanin-like [Rhododendron vialii]|uniref:umecyanin-like n=1 Tax=Rhododendron vialii TaxID=182163 RepID=UPI00265ECD4A|nr:umecyanin-like [Rhododendron vialii]
MAIELKLFAASFMLAAALLQGSEAETSHVVLGTSGWIVPSGGSAEYVTWAAAQTFAVGDFLIFNYATGAHDVAEVSKTAYEGCTSTTTITLATTGPTNITLSTAGEHYYICTVGSHCNGGQKLAINVTASTTTSTPPPPGTTTASPPPPGTTSSPPPPSSAATPFATAALPMITLFSIVLAMLH